MKDIEEYRELEPIVRRLVRIRVKLRIRVKDGDCYGWKAHSHIHIRNSVYPSGTLHLAEKDLSLSREGKAALLIHEAIHIKLGISRHSQNFWNLQRTFFSDKFWNGFFK